MCLSTKAAHGSRGMKAFLRYCHGFDSVRATGRQEAKGCSSVQQRRRQVHLSHVRGHKAAA